MKLKSHGTLPWDFRLSNKSREVSEGSQAL